jgi:hypothetical protein
MLDSGLLSKNFIGRDGFVWWIGQVPDAKFWKGNLPSLPQNSPSDLPGFKYRVKVRILGYHTSDLKNLPDEDLPWALVMLPTTAGSGSGANATTPRFSGGEFVFGFFLDGDNGQQPVIIGLLGNSTQTLLSKSLPSVGFKPFSGHTSSGKSVPTYGLRDSKGIQSSRIPNNNQKIPTGSKGGAPNVVVSGTSPNPNQAPNQEATNSTADLKTAHQERQQQNNNEFPLAVGCKKDKKKKDGIKTAIRRLVKTVKGIQKYYDSYISPTINFAQNLASEINLCAGLIVGYLKDLLNDARAWLTREINRKLENTVSDLSIKKQIEAGEQQQKAVDAISCIFNRIISGLKDLIVSFLNRMLDRILSASECIIDTMIGSLLNSILAPLQSAISVALGPLNSLLSGTSGALNQAIDFVTAIERFISCEESDQCPEIEKWSWLDGPKPGTEDNYSNALLNIGFASTISAVLNNPTISPLSTNGNVSSCFSGLSNCGPPTIEIFGGGGIGALANAVIGANGEILAVNLLSSGIDYYSNPFVYFNDGCGNGSGAKAEAIIGTEGEDCGKIVSIRVIDGGKGYLRRSDGSLGSEGEVTVGIGSDATALVIPNGADFTINNEIFGFDSLSSLITSSSGLTTSILSSGVEIPCGITTAYPSVPISVVSGSSVSVPPGGSIILSASMPQLTQIPNDTIKSGTTYTFPTGADITVPTALDSNITGITTTTPTDDYGVILELDEVLILNTGVNYSPDDKICITPDNGANLVPEFDPYGRLLNVKILNKGDFVTERPVITICSSETGVNAEMFAVLKATPATREDAERYGFNQDKIISVVDCVGKVNV